LRAIHGVSRKEDARFNEPQLTRNLERVVRLAAFAERHESTSRALAAAWTLRNPAVDGAIGGFCRPTKSTRSSPRQTSNSPTKT
jgi:aryl-alcohol dehydrogenase-like predicted oxidoreductase